MPPDTVRGQGSAAKLDVHDSALTLAGVMIVQEKQPVQTDAFGKDRFGTETS